MAAQYPNRVEQTLRAFGLRLLRAGAYALVRGDELPPDGADFPDVEITSTGRLNTGADDEERLSYLGTPVFCDLLLKENDDDDGLLIDTVLFDVQQSRNIVTTAIQGRNGTVKEYISDGDYQVNIRGLLVEQTKGVYPTDQVQEMVRLLRLQQPVQAVSPFLQLFDIYDLVVQDWRMPQLEGFQNMQPFELVCISDTPIELIEDDV